jgi:putative polyketide hydroxylase
VKYDVREETEVLVIGGGLVGLCAALFLRQHGVRTVLAERRDHTSPQPKARRISIRTMELFRQLGLDDAVTEAAAALADFQGMWAGPTLAEAQPLPFHPPGGDPGWAGCSPAQACLCAQDVLEPLLRDFALARGADVRFGTEVADVAEDDDGVTATLRGRGRIRAGYVIAADGSRSPVRERLGIPRSGPGALRRVTNVYFRADLTGVLRGRGFNLCQTESVPGAFASINGTDRWIFSTAPGPARAPADWAALVGAAAGVPGLPVEVLSVQEWEVGLQVADRLSQGRFFLAGDAVHVMPPFAAQGANTGIQDAHNLAWKLAWVLAGTAGPRLLDSYQAERHPAAWFAARESAARGGGLRQANEDRTLADPLALTLGYQYPDGAVIADGSTAATSRLDLRGQPGTRLPHRWLAGRSTLDLAGRDFTLVTGPDGGWPDGGWSGSGWSGSGVRVAQVDLPDWAGAVGTGAGGALLVRPDQVIAWRHRGPCADPRRVVSRAVATLAHR